MSRFSYLHNLVNITLRDMCYTFMESCFQGLSFIYLHLRPLNNLWGCYDPKTENMAGFLLVTVISSHRIKGYTYFESFDQWLHFLCYTMSFEQFMYSIYELCYDPQKHENVMIKLCFQSTLSESDEEVSVYTTVSSHSRFKDIRRQHEDSNSQTS